MSTAAPDVSRYGEGAPVPVGTARPSNSAWPGQEFLALNGGPHVKFNDAISLLVSCRDQEEVDYSWDRLSGGATTASR
jgi:two-component system sensor histidine kinase QseC